MARFFKGKTALVTGAGRGIGAAVAKELASRGARVAMVSRSRNRGELEAAAREAGGIAIEADVSDEKAVLALFARIRKELGRLDILVNNAAIVEPGDFESITAEAWDRVMAVNLRGPFLCSREAFKLFRAGGDGGVVINLGSLAGIRGTEKFKGLCSYIASKHGIVGLTESLAVEGRELGIRSYCVAPGAVETAMLRKAAPQLRTKTSPADIARTIADLCEDPRGLASGEVLEIHSNL